MVRHGSGRISKKWSIWVILSKWILRVWGNTASSWALVAELLMDCQVVGDEGMNKIKDDSRVLLIQLKEA